MVKHTVMFRLEADAEKRAALECEFKEKIEQLPAMIPELASIHVNTDDGIADPGNWHIVLTADVPDYEALRLYAGHPEHLKCVAIIKPFIAARACVDYTF